MFLISHEFVKMESKKWKRLTEMVIHRKKIAFSASVEIMRFSLILQGINKLYSLKNYKIANNTKLCFVGGKMLFPKALVKITAYLTAIMV